MLVLLGTGTRSTERAHHLISARLTLDKMASINPKFDEYIANAAPFAQPILKHLRKVMHAGCPQLEETIKWGMPHFDYEGVLGRMAAFKEHCSFGFWKGSLLFATDAEREGMGHFGRITSLADLPAENVLIGYVKKAAELNEAGIKSPARAKPKKHEPLAIPGYFAEALKKNKKARMAFEAFSYSHKKEYVEWLTEAKREATREQRLATAIEWLTAGRPRNWKYQRPARAASAST